MWRSCMVMMGACAAMVAQAASIEWMPDIDAAAEKAAREGKMMLVEFTGSDWCKACILQKKRVLEQPAFAEWVQKHYIPVVVDVPNNAALVGGKEQLQKNKKFCDDHGVKIFPSLLIMSPELVLIGGCQGAHSSPQSAISALESCMPAVDAYKQAMSLQGEARARALYDIYRQQPQEFRKYNYPLMQQIAEADANDVTGLRAEYAQTRQMKELEKALAQARSFDTKLAVINDVLAQVLPDNKASVVRYKESLLRMEVTRLMAHPSSVGDILKARDLSLQAVECITDEKKRTEQKRVMLEYFTDPEALFKARTDAQKNTKK